eukprot:Opistho-2@26302
MAAVDVIIPSNEDKAFSSGDENSSADELEFTTANGIRLQATRNAAGDGIEVQAVLVDDIVIPVEEERLADDLGQKKRRGNGKALSAGAKERLKQKKREKKRQLKKKKVSAHPVISVSGDAENIISDNTSTDAAAYKARVLANLPKTTQVLQVDSARKITDLLEDELAKGKSTAFFIFNLSTVIGKMIEWKTHLPRVHPFYAAKCNPDVNIMSTLLSCGAGFDCASKTEMELALGLGTKPENIIFANPCKMIEHIQYAHSTGIKMMTFDNEAELVKVAKYHPTAEMVLRILSDDSHSTMPFGSKFGASSVESRNLLRKAHELKVKIVGVSFHVGSGCQSAEAYVNTFRMAKDVFDMAPEYGFTLNFLDIGGGWPGVNTEALNFPEIAKRISPILDSMFEADVRVIAEPGRFFAAECATLAANVIARRERNVKTTAAEMAAGLPEMKKIAQYYISDGVYGSFNNIIFDHQKPEPQILRSASASSATSLENDAARLQEQFDALKVTPAEKLQTTLFGPTCDSMDIITTDALLPPLDVGDWLYFMNMGSYTSASSSEFNGFKRPTITYIVN